MKRCLIFNKYNTIFYLNDKVFIVRVRYNKGYKYSNFNLIL